LPLAINDSDGNAVCIKFVFVQTVKFVFRKINKKLLLPELYFLTPMYIKSFVGWFLAFKGREGREWERREEGVRPLP